jgi:carbamoyl-phosphate synthase/aspartate carbamoyltransferase/dihydroorotase
MSGPSFCGQIINFTYPIIGNYGIPSDFTDKNGLIKNFESDRIWCKGILVQTYCHSPNHWNMQRTLSEWMKSHNIPGLYGIDTRALTKKIRSQGTLKGKIICENNYEVYSYKYKNLVDEVSRRSVREYGNGDITILIVDCGVKENIVRCLVKRGARVIVVPYDYDFNQIDYDGLLISNGPGDPSMCVEAIKNIRTTCKKNKPIFGICQGSQLLALANGHETFKMKFGNRGHNQPVLDILSGNTYITAQNHGYAVSNKFQPGWHPYFVNVNDKTNEGIIHATKPFFGIQFHPEARGGPHDTEFLFDHFIDLCRQYPNNTNFKTKLLKPIKITSSKKYNKILILGSGGLSIGQAGEFDYSGSQAIKSYKEENIKTVLVNPNIASIQTDKNLADKVYYLPVNVKNIKNIIDKEKPDAISLSFGGQTALNCGIELYKKGILKDIEVLGTSIPSIISTEDRDLFCKNLEEIKEPFPQSKAANNVSEAIQAAKEIGYPVICRVAFALGGLGSGFANNKEELTDLVKKAFTKSPQVLIEKDLRGWKEIEYEVVRDVQGNCITVCNMENLDPLGIHTGDSIVVAPSQTINSDEYHMLRTSAIKIVKHLKIIGECNVQYALNPNSMEYAVIECNPRLSRSSALASKATGYPLASVAAKLGLGKQLFEVTNNVTGTTACFEPSLDYCVIKIPRWDLNKFSGVSSKLGSGMKSVGEVMSIARTFEEGLQKAIRMVSEEYMGVEKKYFKGDIDKELSNPTNQRLMAICKGLYDNTHSIEHIHNKTGIDRWFLSKINNIISTGKEIDKIQSILDINHDLLKKAKEMGFSDLQVADRLTDGSKEIDIRKLRKKMGIIPIVKQIDTMAAEFPSETNYLYMTYNALKDDVNFSDNGIMVLGSGSYKIGSSVEFDYCSMQCIKEIHNLKKKTIMVNFNPETVSTDYDESDRLYFEELSQERVMDIYEKENSEGIIISMGGQLPNNIAMGLYEQKINILGTSPISIDNCENRSKYSAMLDRLGIEQPQWSSFTDFKSAQKFCENIKYPCLIRPSYVLSGAAMKVVYNNDELKTILTNASQVSPKYPVVITKFIEEAQEIDVDGIANSGKILNLAISEHLEMAGTHSGDATLILPSIGISKKHKEKINHIVKILIKELNITGPFNTQFIIKNDWVGVIETNLRASRSVPFVSKIYNHDMIKFATKAILGKNFTPTSFQDVKHVGVKSPQFSFTRLLGADPILGVEMSSTGEVACLGENVEEAYLKSLESSRVRIPIKGETIGICLNSSKYISIIKRFVSLGYLISPQNSITEKILKEHNITLSYNSIKMVLDLTNNCSSNKKIRRHAIDYNISLMTNINQIKFFTQSLEKNPIIHTKSYLEYF